MGGGGEASFWAEEAAGGILSESETCRNVDFHLSGVVLIITEDLIDRTTPVRSGRAASHRITKHKSKSDSPFRTCVIFIMQDNRMGGGGWGVGIRFGGAWVGDNGGGCSGQAE